jgi:hypothetical protein
LTIAGTAELVARQFGPLLTFLVLRLLPTGIYTCLRDELSPRARTATSAACVVLVSVLALTHPSAPALLTTMACTYVYFASLAAAVHWLAGVTTLQPPTVVAFAGIVALSLVLPAWSAPTRFAPLVVLVGWDFALGCYSFWTDTHCRNVARCGLQECVTFLLVHPTYVYAQRASQASRASLRAPPVRRIAAGLAGLSAQCLALALLVGFFHLDTLARHSVAAWALWHVTQAAMLYVALASMASLRIGIMAVLGFAVPECFEHPLSARTPAIFWRRWNRWTGQWALTYIYRPCVRSSLPLFQRARVPSRIVATMITFLCVGALHDAYAFLAHGLHHERAPRVSFAYTFVFAAHGAALLAYQGMEHCVQSFPGAAMTRSFQQRVMHALFVPYLVAASLLLDRAEVDDLSHEILVFVSRASSAGGRGR